MKDEHVIRYFIDQVLLFGYEAAKQAGILRIVRRYSRGNTAIQSGRVLNKASLEELRARGDAGAARLARAQRRWEKQASKAQASA